MSEWFDYMSMGGGALLEYIANKGKLPGIQALVISSKLKVKSEEPRTPTKTKTKTKTVAPKKTAKTASKKKVSKKRKKGR